MFAIAITLLALELRVPQLPENATLMSLGHALLQGWPSYLAFVISFGTILVMWINHHQLSRIITVIDHSYLLLNGLLLMCVTAVPFPTALVATYMTRPGATLAAAVWCLYFALIAVVYNVLWRYARHNRRLIGAHVPDSMVESIDRRYRFGPLFYVGAAVLALVYVPLSIAANIGLAVLFAVPHRTTRATGPR